MYKVTNIIRIPDDWEDRDNFKIENYTKYEEFEDFDEALKEYDYQLGLFLKTYLDEKRDNFTITSYYLNSRFYIKPKLEILNE